MVHQDQLLILQFACFVGISVQPIKVWKSMGMQCPSVSSGPFPSGLELYRVARKDLWGSAQLQILDIVCCKVFDDFLCDAGEDGMVCGDLMDDPKQLKHLA